MTSPSSRSRYSDLPLKPDNAEGVGEWARKIKALQQQVDADEEAEHKRLQDEIAASRIARKRRSKGVVSPTSANFAESIGDPKPIADRQKNQAEAFEKLAGNSNSDVTNSIANARAWMSSTSAGASASKPSGPVSLAAFMGGRATGPVLNKHAPQQNVHDPTQFEDRTRITAPHPVFGRGGVAMPGMATSNRFPRKEENSNTPVVSPKYSNGRVPLRETPPLAVRERSASPTKSGSVSPQRNDGRDRMASAPDRSSANIAEPRSASPQKRERTFSTPSPAFPLATAGPSSEKERPVSPLKTAPRERTISTPGGNSKEALTAGSDTIPPSRPISTSFTPPKAPAQAPRSPPYKSPVVTPSLAKPIRPDPKPSPQAPQLTVSPNTSPAFLKPPVQKEPTPSISRLQGRGFVQNMVKVSKTLESPPSSTQTTPDRPGRKASVLDRWQYQGSPSPSPTSPPITSPKPLTMRKSWSVEPTSSPKPTTEARAAPKPAKPVSSASRSDTEPLLPRRNSQSSLDSQGTGLGSATTLVVFKPSTNEKDLGSFRDVNELGVKRGAAVIPPRQKLPVATGSPLNHPTKERARKPSKKARGPAEVKVEPASLVLSDAPTSSPTQPSSEGTTRIVTSPSESESPVPIKLPKPAPVSRSSNGSSSIGRVTDRWAEQAIIGVRPVGSHSQPSGPEAPKAGGMVGRRALPGLAVTPGITPGGRSPSPSKPVRAESLERSPASSGPPTSKHPFDQNSPTTPSRHSRIPSTGNRATVMDVAQTFVEPDKRSPVDEISSPPESPEEPEPLPPLKHTLRQNVSSPMIERRRSSYNSAVTLPPLQEEVTPAQTPSGTLARGTSVCIEASVPAIHGLLHRKSERIASEDSDLVEISHDDPPLPNINIDALLQSHLPSFSRADLITVSVEVMTIFGNSATMLSRDIDIFYDEEILAIVHRSKSKTSGLVSTAVYGWFGKNSNAGELELGKLDELSKRYRTTLIIINQYAEPLDMLWILGNKLAMRQGKRAHWSSDNTTMHVVRSKWDIVFIDEIELNVKNLCSGFSYCITVLETVYVWYGCGSTVRERNAALAYGRSLSQNVVELEEGQSRDDEMFWMILGEDAFANANYWQWRSSAADITPRVWEVSEQTVQPVDFLSMKDAPTVVYLIDCIWEFFILVGSEARAQRQNIRTALHCASELAKRVCGQRPHDPPIHVVVLPSQVPLDLKMHFRELDESLVNHQVVPEHMNLISLKDAHDHLQRTSWERFSLRDPFMLPLGIQPEMVY